MSSSRSWPPGGAASGSAAGQKPPATLQPSSRSTAKRGHAAHSARAHSPSARQPRSRSSRSDAPSGESADNTAAPPGGVCSASPPPPPRSGYCCSGCCCALCGTVAVRLSHARLSRSSLSAHRGSEKLRDRRGAISSAAASTTLASSATLRPPPLLPLPAPPAASVQCTATAYRSASNPHTTSASCSSCGGPGSDDRVSDRHAHAHTPHGRAGSDTTPSGDRPAAETDVRHGSDASDAMVAEPHTCATCERACVCACVYVSRDCDLSLTRLFHIRHGDLETCFVCPFAFHRLTDRVCGSDV
eukprot:352791-Chlamydomonas_euryale.AAC.12